MSETHMNCVFFPSYYDRFFPAVICDYHFAEVRCLDAAFMGSYGVVVHKFIIGLINSLFTKCMCLNAIYPYK